MIEAGYNPTFDGTLYDITDPVGPVEVVISRNSTGGVLHVNIGGVCALRVCRISGPVTLDEVSEFERARG